jgi:uncharacterized protein YjbI with pentapeptide repeats
MMMVNDNRLRCAIRKGQMMMMNDNETPADPEDTVPEWAQRCWDHMHQLVLGSWRLLKAAERDGVRLAQGTWHPTQWWTEDRLVCVTVFHDPYEGIRYAVGAPDRACYFADPESALDHVLREGMVMMKREDVIAARAEGRSIAGKDLRGLDLSGLDMSDMDLRQVDFRSACLDDSVFACCDFRGAFFSAASMLGANFERSNMEGAYLGSVKAEDAHFDSANLRATDMSDSDFARASFRLADMEGASARRSKFRGADLSETNLVMTDFAECDLRNASLRDAVFHSTNFEGSDMKDDKE